MHKALGRFPFFWEASPLLPLPRAILKVLQRKTPLTSPHYVFAGKSVSSKRGQANGQARSNGGSGGSGEGPAWLASRLTVYRHLLGDAFALWCRRGRRAVHDGVAAKRLGKAGRRRRRGGGVLWERFVEVCQAVHPARLWRSKDYTALALTNVCPPQ